MSCPQLRSAQEAIAGVADGAHIVMAGGNDMAPMALVRELVRQGKRDLRLVLAPAGGLNVDLLIGAGAVASIELSSVNLGEFGFAPQFRRAAEKGSLDIKDST